MIGAQLQSCQMKLVQPMLPEMRTIQFVEPLWEHITLYKRKRGMSLHMDGYSYDFLYSKWNKATFHRRFLVESTSSIFYKYSTSVIFEHPIVS